MIDEEFKFAEPTPPPPPANPETLAYLESLDWQPFDVEW